MTIDGLINAEYDFKAIGEWFKSVYETISTNADISGLWASFTSILNMLPLIATGAIFLVLSLVEVFFGKKLLGIQKFLLCFAVGYTASVAYLAPLLPEGFTIPSWIIGVVVGAVAALLFKLIYFLAYIVAAGYSVYIICMGGFYLPEAVAPMVKGNMVIALAAGAVAIVLALIFKKLIEMAGTAALGGWFVWLSLIKLFAGLNIQLLDEGLIKIIVIAVVALLGAIVQIKTRKRKF